MKGDVRFNKNNILLLLIIYLRGMTQCNNDCLRLWNFTNILKMAQTCSAFPQWTLGHVQLWCGDIWFPRWRGCISPLCSMQEGLNQIKLAEIQLPLESNFYLCLWEFRSRKNTGSAMPDHAWDRIYFIKWPLLQEPAPSAVEKDVRWGCTHSWCG